MTPHHLRNFCSWLKRRNINLTPKPKPKRSKHKPKPKSHLFRMYQQEENGLNSVKDSLEEWLCPLQCLGLAINAAMEGSSIPEDVYRNPGQTFTQGDQEKFKQACKYRNLTPCNMVANSPAKLLVGRQYCLHVKILLIFVGRQECLHYVGNPTCLPTLKCRQSCLPNNIFWSHFARFNVWLQKKFVFFKI